MDAFDHQDLSVPFPLAPGFCRQPPVAGRKLARLQRAAESPRQSSRSRRHEVVEGGGVRFVNIGVDTVVLGDLGVHTKKDRGRHMGQVSATQRPLDAFNFNA